MKVKDLKKLNKELKAKVEEVRERYRREARERRSKSRERGDGAPTAAAAATATAAAAATATTTATTSTTSVQTSNHPSTSSSEEQSQTQTQTLSDELKITHNRLKTTTQNLETQASEILELRETLNLERVKAAALTKEYFEQEAKTSKSSQLASTQSAAQADRLDVEARELRGTIEELERAAEVAETRSFRRREEYENQVKLYEDDQKFLNGRVSELEKVNGAQSRKLERIKAEKKVSERSERALTKTRIRATTKLTLFSIFLLARLPPDPLKMRRLASLAHAGSAGDGTRHLFEQQPRNTQR